MSTPTLNDVSESMAKVLSLFYSGQVKDKGIMTEFIEPALREVVERDLEGLMRNVQYGKSLFLHHKSKVQIEKIFRRVDHAISKLDFEEFIHRRKELISQEDFQYLLDITIDRYEAGHHVEATFMCSVLSFLNPAHSYPYVLQASITWKERGGKEACKLYDNFIEWMSDPVLYYFAANCYAKNSQKRKAKDLLTKALKLCHELKARDVKDLVLKIHELLSEIK